MSSTIYCEDDWHYRCGWGFVEAGSGISLPVTPWRAASANRGGADHLQLARQALVGEHGWDRPCMQPEAVPPKRLSVRPGRRAAAVIPAACWVAGPCMWTPASPDSIVRELTEIALYLHWGRSVAESTILPFKFILEIISDPYIFLFRTDIFQVLAHNLIFSTLVILIL